MIDEIRNELFSLQDVEYQKFHAKLCPNTQNIIGVRVPAIRLLAKKVLKQNYREYIETNTGKYYEENMLEGILIATAPLEIDEKLKYLDSFIPKINNWAVCDMTVSSFKLKKDAPKMWEYLLKYRFSDQEFELRFMIVMWMGHFIDKVHNEEIIQMIDQINSEHYYVNMAIAWLISVLYIKDEVSTMAYLMNNHLSDWTYNKALQKIIESNRVSKEQKDIIRSMKRK